MIRDIFPSVRFKIQLTLKKKFFYFVALPGFHIRDLNIAFYGKRLTSRNSFVIKSKS